MLDIFKVKYLIPIYEKLHGASCRPLHVTLGVDGVQENRTNKVSLLVFALKFEGCRCVLPLAIGKSYPGHDVDQDYILQGLVDDLK